MRSRGEAGAAPWKGRRKQAISVGGDAGARVRQRRLDTEKEEG